MDEATRAHDLVARVARALADHGKKENLLDKIAWPRVVEERFFADGAGRPEAPNLSRPEPQRSAVPQKSRETRLVEGARPPAKHR